MRRFLACLHIGMLLLSGNPVSAAAYTYESPLYVAGATTIGVQQAKSLFDSRAVFIDVRNPKMFIRMHIPGSYHLDLKNGFDKPALERVARKDEPIVIYSSGTHCSRGYRAVEMAVSWGFRDVRYFRGGIVDWRDAKYPFKYAGPKQRETW